MNTRNHLVLGTFILLSLAGLTVATFRLTDLRFGPRQVRTVYFGADSLVTDGLEVYTAGTRVGTVRGVELVPDAQIAEGRYVQARVELLPDLTLWEGAKVVIESRSILGGIVLELDRGDPKGAVLPADRALDGKVDLGLVGGLSDILADNRANLRDTIANAREFSERLKTGGGTLDRLINDPALYDKLLQASDKLLRLSERLTDGEGTMGKLMTSDELYIRFNGVVEKLDGALEGIERGEGTVGQPLAELKAFLIEYRKVAELLKDPEQGVIGLLVNDVETRKGVQKTLADLQVFTRRLNASEGTLAKLMEDPAIYDDLAALTGNMRSISDQINSGRGTLGLLVKDEQVYEELLRMLEAFREGGELARENAPIASMISFTSIFFNVLN